MYFSDPEVGRRAAAEIRRRAHEEGLTYTDTVSEIEITSAMLWKWENYRCGPATPTLQRMAHAGYDVHFILTGERRSPCP